MAFCAEDKEGESDPMHLWGMMIPPEPGERIYRKPPKLPQRVVKLKDEPEATREVWDDIKSQGLKVRRGGRQALRRLAGSIAPLASDR